MERRAKDVPDKRTTRRGRKDLSIKQFGTRTSRLGHKAKTSRSMREGKKCSTGETELGKTAHSGLAGMHSEPSGGESRTERQRESANTT